METNTLIAFVVNFAGGPALCALLLRLPTRLWVLILLALGVIAAAAVAIWLQPRTGPTSLMGSLLTLWLAWVLAVALMAQALRRRIAHPVPRRWVTIIALLATTLPWFGLATARMMV
ncbi:MAG: hypothetical protein QNJ09_09495 [Paracoccaceae bacterium]|nr:hypothetical protein [Paracoccaceae bacterium]